MRHEAQVETVSTSPQHPHQGHRHGNLADQGANCRSLDPPPHSEHEPQVEHQVEAEGDDGDDQGRPGVLESSQHPGDGHRCEHGGHTKTSNAQIPSGLFSDYAAGTEPSGHRRRNDHQHDRHEDSDDEGQPESVDTGLSRTMAIPRSHPARGGGRRRIGEENEETRERRQGC